ncbi:MAG: OmpH family outer membrane protein [Bdellovibrionales bacterium]
MKQFTQALAVVALFFAQNAMSADLKIGYIDLQKAIQDTKAGKKAKADMEKDIEKKKKELQDKEKELQKMTQDFEKKSMVLSEEIRQKKQMELQQEIMKYRENVGKSQMELQAKERDLTAPILEKMKKVIEKVAKDEKLAMVLEKSEHSVVWAEKELDITEKVVSNFEKM